MPERCPAMCKLSIFRRLWLYLNHRKIDRQCYHCKDHAFNNKDNAYYQYHHSYMGDEWL